MQKRIHSLYEAIGNTLLGMGLSYAASFFIYPALGMTGNPGTYAVVTAFFTALSIARGYVVRRLGNWFQHRRI